MMGLFSTPVELLPFLGTFPLLSGLPPELLDELAGNLRYLELSAGEALLRQGEPGDALYLIVDGCFEARQEAEGRGGAARVLGTAGRGAVVGEMAVITGDRRSCSLYAVRESSALRLAQTDFQRILEHHPQQMFRLCAQIVRRASTSLRRRPPGTIALLPLPGVDLDELAPALAAEIGRLRRARLIDGREAAARFGAEAAGVDGVTGAHGATGPPRDQRLLQWLAEEEHACDVVLYQAEAAASPWTRRCLAQADLVLLIADAGADGALGAAERALLWQRQAVTEAPIELLLVHRHRDAQPQGTRRFLAPRPRLRLHHHLARGSAADLRRLARLLTGNGVQLVLSGGGARGLAHLGVLRALEEAGVPVDLVGGASMGAAIGALRARGWDAQRAQGAMRTALRHDLKDLTLPLLSLIRGRRGTRVARELFGDLRIEDLWINYFALSADLCSGEEVVHRQGPLWEAIRAAVSLPGLVPPVTAGGRCLVDGGVLNNLPTDVMARLCAGHIIAVDVTEERAFEVPRPLPLDVTGWRLLLRRANPLRAADLHIGDVLLRAAEIASARMGRGAAERAPVSLYVHPPVQGFRLLDFRRLDEIAAVGHRAAREGLATWWDRASGLPRRRPLHH